MKDEFPQKLKEFRELLFKNKLGYVILLFDQGGNDVIIHSNAPNTEDLKRLLQLVIDGELGKTLSNMSS